MILRGLVLLCLFPLSWYCNVRPFDVEVEGRVLRGLVLLFPLPTS